MIRFLTTAAALLLAATPTLAGKGLMCTGPERISAHFPLGAGTGLSLIGAEIKAGDRTWTMDESATGATHLTIAQVMLVDDRYLIDLTDPNYESVRVRVRLYFVPESDVPVIGGYMEIVDVGAWAISCSVG